MANVREVQDHYFREAKRLGYVARSAFKLKEILEKKRLINPGDYVLDLGCAPGAWLQVACQHIGPAERGGLVLGLDLKPVRKGLRFCHEALITREVDVFKIAPAELLDLTNRRHFNAVLSDMMAATTGHHHSDHYQSIHLARRALELAGEVLCSGGSFVVKVFEGVEYPALLDECKARFDKVKGFKPKASRNESTEMYIIGESFVPVK
jgi:23S rRNA (uridine2552-2'-O)-methyltransferase